MPTFKSGSVVLTLNGVEITSFAEDTSIEIYNYPKSKYLCYGSNLSSWIEGEVYEVSQLSDKLFGITDKYGYTCTFKNSVPLGHLDHFKIGTEDIEACFVRVRVVE